MKILNVQLPNGVIASGTFEEWVAAMLGGATPDQMAKTVERLHQIQGARAMQALPAANGVLMRSPRHVVMDAEPGMLGALLGR